MFHQGSSLKKMSLHYSQIKLISTAACLLLKSLPELTEKSCNPVSAKCWLAPFCFFCYPEICIDTSFLTSNSMFSKQHSKYKLQLCVLSHPVMSNSVTYRLLCLWNFPGKNTRVSCHFLLWGSSQTRNQACILPHLLHCRQLLYHWATGRTISFLEDLI